MRSNADVGARRTLEAKTPEGKVFGETLGRLREAHVPKLTQEALAHAAGLTTNHVSDLERGKKVPTLTTILQLAHALDVPPTELLADFTAAQVRKSVKPHLR